MKIEPGKFYRCRDGSKARIYAVDGEGPWPIHGYARENLRFWDSDGVFRLKNELHDLDLIEEWQDPKPWLRAWIGKMYNRDCYEIIFKEDGIPGPCDYVRAEWLDEKGEG